MKKQILIIGAGEGGRQLLAEVSLKKDWQVVGFLDDQKITGFSDIPVLGKINDLKKILSNNKIDQIYLAIPSLKGKRLREIIDLVKDIGADFKIMPGIFESIEYYSSGQVAPGKIRNIEIKDLLDREPINLDASEIKKVLANKKILITGAAGSIGREIARQALIFDSAQLLLIDNFENGLFEVQNDLNNERVKVEVGDIKDYHYLRQVFRSFGPEIVFHAAAHKHVHLMEQTPKEAIKNNILGSDNVIKLALENNVSKFVFISTDKAVEPVSIMGATKRFTEQQILSLKNNGTSFSIVRFGNVLGSFGSVIPLWQRQLSQNKPLTITHPDMERYFMTIPEAVSLIFQAAALSSGRQLFALRMGKQYKIMDLAKDLIKLSGLEPDKYEFKFIGVRPGEKLSETLSEKEEKIVNSGHKMIMEIKPIEVSEVKIQTALKNLKTINTMNRKQIDLVLKNVIKSFQPKEINPPKKINKNILFSPPQISKQEIQAVTSVLKSGWLTMGKKNQEFEADFRNFIGSKYALSVNSATAGLHLVLLGLNIGHGDEVILPSYTFSSCANILEIVGAKPIFAEINRSFLIEPEDIERKITKKTKAILVVHFAGQMADMPKIMTLAKKYNLSVIEDCAHSPGASINNRPSGTWGKAGIFSFYPTKNLTTGEGGMIVTEDSDLAQRIKNLRLHGMNADASSRYAANGKWRYDIIEPGLNYVLTDFAAAMGVEQLKKLDKNNMRRSEIANIYIQNLSNQPQIEIPRRNETDIWHLFPILVPAIKREEIIEKLKEFNIQTSVHFIPLHLMSYYAQKYHYKEGDLPITEEMFSREISLPISPGLKDKEAIYITEVLNYVLETI